MKCQTCSEAATCHVTEIVEGKAVEYHLCEKHMGDLDALKGNLVERPSRLGADALQSFTDPTATQKVAAYLLPPLCLALLDEIAGVRIQAAFRLAQLRHDAESALGALRDALRDPDEHVREMAQWAIEQIDWAIDQASR